MDFPCDACGLCCRHVDRSDITKGLSRGDGVCVHLADDMSTCKIYDARPDCCRIDHSYPVWSDVMSFFEYHQANASVCNALRYEHGLIDLPLIVVQENM